MLIVLTGGGSGGHITPILAVASELKRLQPDCRLVYIGQKGDALSDIPAQSPYIDQVYGVRAGKFRRYHGEGWRQILDMPTMAKNIRDAAYVGIGLVQSHMLLRKLRPDVVFIKGGFVGVPVGLAAAMRHIPFITHDSDAIPGLANRIVARWAAVHAVALPKEVYKGYAAAKTVTTGVPVQPEFTGLTATKRAEYRTALRLPRSGRVLCVTGGGLGARRINDAVLSIAGDLLDAYPDLHVLHLVGRANEMSVRSAYEDLLSPRQRERVRVEGYVNDLYRYSGAADLVVTRAGATVMAEFAVQARPCIIIPNPVLTGGHQTKNAAYIEAKQAGLMVDEEAMHHDPAVLRAAIDRLLNDPAQAAALGENLRSFARPDAANSLAVVLLEQVKA